MGRSGTITSVAEASRCHGEDGFGRPRPHCHFLVGLENGSEIRLYVRRFHFDGPSDMASDNPRQCDRDFDWDPQ
jgi:hypothetical protein